MPRGVEGEMKMKRGFLIKKKIQKMFMISTNALLALFFVVPSTQSFKPISYNFNPVSENKICFILFIHISV